MCCCSCAAATQLKSPPQVVPTGLHYMEKSSRTQHDTWSGAIMMNFLPVSLNSDRTRQFKCISTRNSVNWNTPLVTTWQIWLIWPSRCFRQRRFTLENLAEGYSGLIQSLSLPRTLVNASPSESMENLLTACTARSCTRHSWPRFTIQGHLQINRARELCIFKRASSHYQVNNRLADD